MIITRIRSAFIATLAAISLASAAHAQVNMSFVTVGNPGNANDTTGYGGVGYTYDIGTYDVTLSQYTVFLNDVAATDTYSLYNTSLGTDLNVAGIARSGASGGYTYSVIGDGNRPVTYVSWFDAARFTNWLSNGQPAGLQGNGTTETGAYTLNGAMSGIITNNGSGQYWIPSENEWYKAAYYDPNKGGPGVGGYWLYSTKSNSAPGNTVGSGANNANYNNGVFSVTQSAGYSSSQNYLTAVGSFTNSASAYGTFDQGGDVSQWNDAVIAGSSRGLLGGAWFDLSSPLQSSNPDDTVPTDPYGFGFRVATIPEPSTVVSLIVGAGMLAFLRRRPF